jgi:hypothetical protein
MRLHDKYKVPMMDREAFDDSLRRARSFGVWVQISPWLQTCLPITKTQALELGNYGLQTGGAIYGQLCEGDGNGCLELSLSSQWLETVRGFEAAKSAALAKLTKEEQKLLGLA